MNAWFSGESADMQYFQAARVTDQVRGIDARELLAIEGDHRQIRAVDALVGERL